MMPAYYKRPSSGLRVLQSGYIYQSEHPVNYCTRCETAIAFAEVAYEDRETQVNYFDFDGVEIATTRPKSSSPALRWQCTPMMSGTTR